MKGPWSKEEDETIIRCVNAGISKWSEIAERIEGRIGKQCRERWFNHLDPNIKKGPWTDEEDRILIEAQGRCVHVVCFQTIISCGFIDNAYYLHRLHIYNTDWATDGAKLPNYSQVAQKTL